MIKAQAKAFVPTEFGNFEMLAYSEQADNRMPELVLISEGLSINENPVNVRIHSECITGDVFQSKRCDCGSQLLAALHYLHTNGGILIYHRQEGRNIGIIEKLKAYNLQDEGMNTAEANIALGHQADARNYEAPISILEDLGVKSIHLITNNPDKINAFDNSTISVIKRVPLEIPPQKETQKYLQTKKDFFGHILDL